MKFLRSFMFVALSFLCIGSFYLILSYFSKTAPIKTPVTIIAQTGPIKEGLKTDYLAEVLDLSIDDPKYLEIDVVEKILGKNPLIKKVSASYLDQDTLYIDYTLHHPTLILMDLENIALDLEGHLFPLSPYFTPKKLPELYLGLEEVVSWDIPLKGKEMALAAHLYALLKEEVRRIDLSLVKERSLGKKEIVVILETAEKRVHMLRLTPKRYKKELEHYQALKETIQKEALVIDLRVPNLAFLTPIA